jgi:hypothetical protein
MRIHQLEGAREHRDAGQHSGRLGEQRGARAGTLRHCMDRSQITAATVFLERGTHEGIDALV